MRRRVVIRNYKLQDFTQQGIEEYFELMCPTLLAVNPLGFSRFEVVYYVFMGG